MKYKNPDENSSDLQALIAEVIRVTELMCEKEQLEEKLISKTIALIDKYKSTINLNVYKGMLICYQASKYQRRILEIYPDKFLSSSIFNFCIVANRSGYLDIAEVKKQFALALRIEDKDTKLRDLLLGSLHYTLWRFFFENNGNKNYINLGREIAEEAFSIDKFNISHKHVFELGAHVISMSGSGKKATGFKMINLSSMAAIVTVGVSKLLGKRILVSKTASRATSSITGSSDIFSLAGGNLNLSVDRMCKIMDECGLGIFNIDEVVPKLNKIYDGKLYNMQIFAGLIGGGAIANPVQAQLINYGLTRGNQQVTLGVLSSIYPDSNIMIVTGYNKNSKPIIDQLSLEGDSVITSRIDGHIRTQIVSPKSFGIKNIAIDTVYSRDDSRNNLAIFLDLIKGQADNSIKSTVAMEVALNLYGSGLADDLPAGTELALQAINSGQCTQILKHLVELTTGDLGKLKSQHFN